MITLPSFSSPRFPDFNPSSFAHGRSAEMTSKAHMMRAALAKTGPGASAIRLRGADWVSWALAGADPAVLLTTDLGVAEVLVTSEGAWVLTDTIESARLVDEEIPAGCSVQVNGWESPSRRESFVVECAGTGRILSDRPRPGEALLPDSLVHAKRTLCATELERYRIVGLLAAQAMTETLTAATSATTERALAGMGARALWDRGLHPALTLCAGARRLPLHRHATPTHEPLGSEAMLVFCARGFGLYACLTRFVTFDGATSPEAARAQEGRHALVRELEAVVLDASVPGATLSALYETLAQAYVARGQREALFEHHQGGTAGYLAREVVAMPSSSESLHVGTVVAWNPSVKGAKIEDTFALSASGGLENLTADPLWPTTAVRGRPRPVPLAR